MKEFKQEIEYGDITQSSFQNILNQYENAKKIIIVDENTHDNCLEFLITAFTELAEAEVILLPAGEENKVMEVCFQVWEALTEYEVGRKDLVINLGGGLVTDMGGFIAAVFKRGLDFVNIPTSLLGMVDAAIGGKTGIDLGPFKNQIGTFTLPIASFVDIRFLSTLPEIELWNGYAEILKHSLIEDGGFWKYVKQIKSSTDLQQLELIQRAGEIKVNIVARDPQEKNERKLLNLGHTIGHALEGLFLEKEKPIHHGHAVAIGILLESRLSHELGFLSGDDLKEIEGCIAKFERISFSETEVGDILHLMKNDKKNSAGKIRGILIQGIGNCQVDFVFEEELVRKVLLSY